MILKSLNKKWNSLNEKRKLGIIFSLGISMIIMLIVFFVFRIDKIILTQFNVAAINKDSLRFELIKDLFELLFVAVTGGLIAYLFKSREETKKTELKEKDERNRIRTNYLMRLGDIYHNIKESRRELRAAGLTSKTYDESEPQPQVVIIEGALLKIYLNQIKIINKHQLELEKLRIEAIALPHFAQINSLKTVLKEMEDYLRKILTEFEKNYPALLKGTKKITLENLEFLDEFTGKTHGDFKKIREKYKKYNDKDDDEMDENKRNPFKTIFSKSYRTAIKDISEKLVS